MILLHTTWDVAIVGAGVAGAVAASVLAKRGQRVLLIEKSTWPRKKSAADASPPPPVPHSATSASPPSTAPNPFTPSPGTQNTALCPCQRRVN